MKKEAPRRAEGEEDDGGEALSHCYRDMLRAGTERTD